MKKLTVLSILTLWAFMAFAQTLPTKCSVFKPSKLITRMLRQSDVNHLLSSPDYCQAESQSGKKTPWIVYSDRDSNVTYTTSTGTTKATFLSLNEKLRIASIENKRALVYVEPVASTTWPKISSQAICKGWVPMDKLLLWDICISDETGVYQKALLCLNADVQSTDRGYGYKEPQDMTKKEALDPTFKFYYVMKKTKGSNGKNLVLLATQPSMSGFSDANLYTWVPEDMFVSWNQRSCIEKTWNKDDIRYFHNKNFIAKTFDEENNIPRRDTFKIKMQDPYPDDDDDFYRWKGDVLRFPILDETTPESEEYQITALQGNMGGEFIDSVRIKKEKFYENRSHINIILLIDATKSMGDYSNAIYQAIKNGCTYFDKKYKIQIGVLLYRDQADGKFETEWLNFAKPNSPALLNFIQKGGNGNYGYKSSPADKTHTESLFFGMQQALMHFKDKEESNVLVIVGDCGNNASDKRVTKDKLVAKIVEKDVNIVGFQVQNPDELAWTLFNTDIQPIIRESLQKKSDNIKKGSKVTARPNNDFSGYIFSNNQDQNSLLFMAEHRHALSGKKMSPDFLEKIMTEVIGGYATKIKNLFDIVHKGTVDTTKIDFAPGVGASGGTQLAKEWLIKKFGTTNVNGLIGFKGHTKKQYDGRNIWKASVFFTHDELVNLISGLQPLYNVACNINADDRKPFYVAVKKCIEKMAPGVEFKDNEINEVLKQSMGINEPTPILKYLILDVLNPQAVKPAEYRSILSKFKMNYEKLQRIAQNKKYPYKMKYNNITYYWIPIEEMP